MAHTPDNKSPKLEPKDKPAGKTEKGDQNRSERNFPVKLWDLLISLENEGLDHIVSWAPHGRCFVVRNQDEFVHSILPVWFRQTKFTSFQRQLNIYGFTRLTAGKDKHGYYHPLFLRNDRNLAKKIERHKLKGTGTRKPGEPDKEPNFYAMPYIPAPKNSGAGVAAAAGNGVLSHSDVARALGDRDRAAAAAALGDDGGGNNVLLAQLLAAQQQQSRFPGLSPHEELALLRAQQQQQQLSPAASQEAYRLAAARRALTLNSLGYGGGGGAGLHPQLLAQPPTLQDLSPAQIDLLLAQARLKAANPAAAAGLGGGAGRLHPLAGLGGVGSGIYGAGGGADAALLANSQQQRAALLQSMMGGGAGGGAGTEEAQAQQDAALRRALLQQSLAGRRDL